MEGFVVIQSFVFRYKRSKESAHPCEAPVLDGGMGGGKSSTAPVICVKLWGLGPLVTQSAVLLICY